MSVRVLRIFSRLNVGGPAVHVILLAEGLAPLGYQVTIFEADRKAGGFMRTQVPRFRLPEAVIDEEVGYVLDLGVDFVSGTRIESADVIGGGSRSRAWVTIIASVLGVPLHRVAEGERGGAFGAARLAREGVGRGQGDEPLVLFGVGGGPGGVAARVADRREEAGALLAGEGVVERGEVGRPAGVEGFAHRGEVQNGSQRATKKATRTARRRSKARFTCIFTAASVVPSASAISR